MVIQDQKITIHPKLKSTFNFLKEIEKEITEILYLKNKAPRSVFIALFSYLETLRCIHTAYHEKTSNEEKLKNASNKKMKEFINKYVLNVNNEWVENNQSRYKKINTKEFVNLRNYLVHFFSVHGKIGIVSSYNDKAKNLEKEAKGKYNALDPTDLHKMIESAAIIILKEWDEDCRKSIRNKDKKFQDRITCVKNVISEYGCVSCK